MKVLAIASILAISAVLAPFITQERDREKADKDFTVVKPSMIKWEQIEGLPEGCMASNLTADSNTAPFVSMFKLPRGTRVPMHWHSANRIVTVISGTLVLGKEGKHEEGMGIEIPAGGYARVPAKSPHWNFVKEDTVFVVSGDKPKDLQWLDKEGEKK